MAGGTVDTSRLPAASRSSTVREVSDCAVTTRPTLSPARSMFRGWWASLLMMATTRLAGGKGRGVGGCVDGAGAKSMGQVQRGLRRRWPAKRMP